MTVKYILEVRFVDKASTVGKDISPKLQIWYGDAKCYIPMTVNRSNRSEV